MSDLLSVGLDVGTTTTQLIVSRLTVENRASSFAVPEMQISERQVLYRSPVHFTPLIGDSLVDGDGVRAILEQEYKAAGISKDAVDTGAVIITGETSRKENANAVLHALSDYAGNFVVATAGPELESILAAKGAGADTLSAQTGKTVLHMDIGGGTSNLALIQDGKITATGCLNVGGRLIKTDAAGKVIYVSPVLRGLTDLQPGDRPTPDQLKDVAQILTNALEMAAGLRPVTELFPKLLTREVTAIWTPPAEDCILSFSGGVADCIASARPSGAFGDIGVELGQAIKNSLLCQKEYVMGANTIRATVIGAGCFSTQLSGSTVFYKNITLPLKNLPVTVFSAKEQLDDNLPQLISSRYSRFDTDTVVLALPGYTGSYSQLANLAAKIAHGTAGKPIILCLEADMAKALGQKLSLLHPDTPCLCIDRVVLQGESFLDIGVPIGPALPVVVKTLVLQNNH
mgnify:CR=1 FL=1